MSKWRDEFEEYRINHALCPQCLGENFEETCIGFLNPQQNPNRHICLDCGWSGFQHQLLPESMKKHLPNA